MANSNSSNPIDAMREMFAQVMAGDASADGQIMSDRFKMPLPDGATIGDLGEWAKASTQLQQIWFEFMAHQAKAAAKTVTSGKNLLDPAQWLVLSQGMFDQFPKDALEAQAKLAQDSLAIWKGVADRFTAPTADAGDETQHDDLPMKDRRFADPAWREHPAFALLHQNYLMLTEYFRQAVRSMKGLDKDKRRQLDFAVTALSDAMSPDNFALTNPVVMKRTIETRGQNLVRGMQHLIKDLKRGQLTHTDPDAFTLGENLAATPGKVVHETPLYQLLQYSPSTKDVYEVPLVIFPPWINHFQTIADMIDCVHLRPNEVIPNDVCHRVIGRFPTDHEYTQPLIHGPFDETFLWCQVQNIKAVDPRRENHQRNFVHVFRRRAVLQ